MLYFRLAFYLTLAYGALVLALQAVPERRHIARRATYLLLAAHFLSLFMVALTRLQGSDFLVITDWIGTPVLGSLTVGLWWRILAGRTSGAPRA